MASHGDDDCIVSACRVVVGGPCVGMDGDTLKMGCHPKSSISTHMTDFLCSSYVCLDLDVLLDIM